MILKKRILVGGVVATGLVGGLAVTEDMLANATQNPFCMNGRMSHCLAARPGGKVPSQPEPLPQSITAVTSATATAVMSGTDNTQDDWILKTT